MMKKTNKYTGPSLRVAAFLSEDAVMIASASTEVEDYEIDPQEIEW